MAQRTVRFKIRQDGVVEETVEGVLGNDCYQLTEKLESALGSLQCRESTSDAYSFLEGQSQLTQEQIQTT